MSNLLVQSARIYFDQGITEITPDVLQETTRGGQTDEVVKARDNLLVRNKKLSHLIARSYLPEGQEIRQILTGDQDGIKKLLVDEGIVDKEEAKNSRFDVDPHPSGSPPFVGSICEDPDPKTPEILIFKVPYPERPDQVTDEQLKSWLASSPDAEPWEPYHLSQWIPYTC